MGSPFPSTLSTAAVVVTANDGTAHSFALGREMRRYAFRVAIAPGQPLVVRIDAPTWSRVGEPADQGVRVDRMAVRAAQ
jgi:hypothetical protein